MKLLLESGAHANKPAIVASDGAKKTPLAYARLGIHFPPKKDKI